MRTNRSPTVQLTAAALLCVALSGCVIAPARPYYVDEGPVAVAPPPPRYEVIGVAPVFGQVWINGFWGWSGGRHAWNGGHWEAPRPGHRWVPHEWRQEGRGWRLHQGYWGRQ